ncbi:hypothetical protein M5D96_004933 [Drosophila gunungcola]|uniref:Uncharacterized protein n=1 Tax=Drosophila gunungcola TaxID=103775 RepID=A0A9P9YUW7_9MUSC|nr:hypothetical protein M5D96_004933 [Drosophila gunungcola]
MQIPAADHLTSHLISVDLNRPGQSDLHRMRLAEDFGQLICMLLKPVSGGYVSTGYTDSSDKKLAINYDKTCIKIIYKLNSRNYIKMSENVAADERQQKAEIPFRESQLDAADQAKDEARRLKLRFCRC